MGRREYTIRRVCAAEGCKETYFSTATTQRDAKDAYQHNKTHPYRCLRHSKPEEVLTEHNQTVTAEFGCILRGEYKPTNTWEGAGTSFAHGPGFRAFAEDFPLGTRLIVTARVELPGDYEIPAPPPEPKPATRYQTDAVDLDG